MKVVPQLRTWWKRTNASITSFESCLEGCYIWVPEHHQGESWARVSTRAGLCSEASLSLGTAGMFPNSTQFLHMTFHFIFTDVALGLSSPPRAEYKLKSMISRHWIHDILHHLGKDREYNSGLLELFLLSCWWFGPTLVSSPWEMLLAKTVKSTEAKVEISKGWGQNTSFWCNSNPYPSRTLQPAARRKCATSKLALAGFHSVSPEQQRCGRLPRAHPLVLSLLNPLFFLPFSFCLCLHFKVKKSQDTIVNM